MRLTLFEKFEAQLKAWDGNLRRAAVELAKEWRTDRYLRRLEAQLSVAESARSCYLGRGRRDRAGRRHRRDRHPARRMPRPRRARLLEHTELGAARDRRSRRWRSRPSSASIPTTTSRSEWVAATERRVRRRRRTSRANPAERNRTSRPMAEKARCPVTGAPPQSTRGQRADAPRLENLTPARSSSSSTGTSSASSMPSGRSRSPCETATGGSCCPRRCGARSSQEHPDDRPDRRRQDRDRPPRRPDRRRAVHQGRGDQVHRGRLCRPGRRIDHPRSGRSRDQQSAQPAAGAGQRRGGQPRVAAAGRVARGSDDPEAAGPHAPQSWSGNRDAARHATDELAERRKARERKRILRLLAENQLEDETIEIEIEETVSVANTAAAEFGDGLSSDDTVRHCPGMFDMLANMLPRRSFRRRVPVREARRILTQQEANRLVDFDAVIDDAIQRVGGCRRCLPRRDRQDDSIELASTAPMSRPRVSSAICCRSSKDRW